MSAKSNVVLILGGSGKTGRRVARAEAVKGVRRLVLLSGQRALGRAPRDFADYARAAAASGVWSR